MKIQVTHSGRGRPYTYAIDAEVKEGDTVLVPAPFWDPHGPPAEATVVATESDYDGPVVRAWLPPAPAPPRKLPSREELRQILGPHIKDDAELTELVDRIRAQDRSDG